MRDEETETFLRAFVTLQDKQKAIMRNMRELERYLRILSLIVILLILSMCANMVCKMVQENTQNDSKTNIVPIEELVEFEYLED